MITGVILYNYGLIFVVVKLCAGSAFFPLPLIMILKTSHNMTLRKCGNFFYNGIATEMHPKVMNHVIMLIISPA